jgi:hypothetical protein
VFWFQVRHEFKILCDSGFEPLLPMILVIMMVYWNQLIQHPPQSTGGQQFPAASVIPPSRGQPYLGTFNPIWGVNAQTQVPVPGYNPMSYYPLQPPPNLLWSSHYMQTAYGPTGLPTGLPPQSHQYP